jgi:DNA-binding NtrC family response regulator
MTCSESSQHACIFALDDDAGFLGLLKEVLERHGHRVHTASSPKAAIKFYEERWREIGMVILDFMMPEMSGDMVFEEFQRTNPDVRAILLTCCQGSVADALFKKGLRGYLPKPFGLAELNETVRQVISDQACSLGSPVPA